MAAPGSSPIAIAFEGISGSGLIPTPVLLAGMLRASEKVSDLIFSPGRPPQVEIHGQLTPVEITGASALTADDTRRIAADLIGTNKQAINTLREQGSCDVSYGLPGMARFRVNVFIQRGSCAIVMRVIPTVIPSFSSLRLPPQLDEAAQVRNGIVLVVGGSGSGKSSTVAALLDRINSQHCYHILTIEDPIEFLHNHKKSTVHQRELHSDAPNFALALRAALRQAPRVIMVGEIRERETLEILLEAAENGHLILSSMNTVDASKTVERIVSSFPATDHQSVRDRLAKTFRYIIAQRLIPRADDGGRSAVVEILKSNSRTRDCIEQGERPGRTLLDAIKNSEAEGMQHFDGEIAKLVRTGMVDLETGLCFASNATVLGQELARN
ncbi:MAG TPA: PilT/PilU family type 4a pilus ATPase [Terriglobales bacterium]|jgi:twitching motility protein PilT|nr:PilT/PilU family type 4a pilus ATPase [Terriglobales bacterium]